MTGLLRLLTWLSPAFPVGAFAYSHGIEYAVECGAIADETGLLVWLQDVLAAGSGRNDAILLRHAHAAAADGERLQRLSTLAQALAPARERRAETLEQGTAFARAAAPWGGLPAGLAYPVAVGALSGRHGLEVDALTAAYLQAIVANLISAAVRLVPLGQSAGLRVQAALEPCVLAVAAASAGQGLDELGGAAFRSDFAAMAHETQYTRLFRS